MEKAHKFKVRNKSLKVKTLAVAIAAAIAVFTGTAYTVNAGTDYTGNVDVSGVSSSTSKGPGWDEKYYGFRFYVVNSYGSVVSISNGKYGSVDFVNGGADAIKRYSDGAGTLYNTGFNQSAKTAMVDLRVTSSLMNIDYTTMFKNYPSGCPAPWLSSGGSFVSNHEAVKAWLNADSGASISTGSLNNYCNLVLKNFDNGADLISRICKIGQYTGSTERYFVIFEPTTWDGIYRTYASGSNTGFIGRTYYGTAYDWGNIQTNLNKAWKIQGWDTAKENSFLPNILGNWNGMKFRPNGWQWPVTNNILPFCCYIEKTYKWNSDNRSDWTEPPSIQQSSEAIDWIQIRAFGYGIAIMEANPKPTVTPSHKVTTNYYLELNGKRSLVDSSSTTLTSKSFYAATSVSADTNGYGTKTYKFEGWDGDVSKSGNTFTFKNAKSSLTISYVVKLKQYKVNSYVKLFIDNEARTGDYSLASSKTYTAYSNDNSKIKVASKYQGTTYDYYFSSGEINTTGKDVSSGSSYTIPAGATLKLYYRSYNYKFWIRYYTKTNGEDAVLQDQDTVVINNGRASASNVTYTKKNIPKTYKVGTVNYGFSYLKYAGYKSLPSWNVAKSWSLSYKYVVDQTTKSTTYNSSKVLKSLRGSNVLKIVYAANTVNVKINYIDTTNGKQTSIYTTNKTYGFTGSAYRYDANYRLTYNGKTYYYGRNCSDTNYKSTGTFLTTMDPGDSLTLNYYYNSYTIKSVYQNSSESGTKTIGSTTTTQTNSNNTVTIKDTSVYKTVTYGFSKSTDAFGKNSSNSSGLTPIKDGLIVYYRVSTVSINIVNVRADQDGKILSTSVVTQDRKISNIIGDYAYQFYSSNATSKSNLYKYASAGSYYNCYTDTADANRKYNNVYVVDKKQLSSVTGAKETSTGVKYKLSGYTMTVYYVATVRTELDDISGATINNVVPGAIVVDSFMWGGDLRLNSGSKGWNNGSCLKGGATYELSTKNATFDMVCWQITVNDATSRTKIKNSSGKLLSSSATEMTTKQGRVYSVDFINTAIDNLYNTNVDLYVNNDTAAKTAWDTRNGTYVNYSTLEPGDLISITQKKKSKDTKYLLERSDGSGGAPVTESLMSDNSMLEASLKGTSDRYVNLYRDSDGSVKYYTDSDATIRVAMTSSGVLSKDTEIADIEKYTKLVTQVWQFDSSLNGVVVQSMRTTQKTEYGMITGKTKVVCVDPALIPIQYEPADKNTWFNYAIEAQYKASGLEDDILSAFKGKTIRYTDYCSGIRFSTGLDLILTSNIFYVASGMVTDNH